MAENPTITIDVSVMLEKLEAELRRAESMVGQSAQRIDSRLRGSGGGGGGVGVVPLGSTAAIGTPMTGGSTFVPAAAGARVGVVAAGAGGGAAAVGVAGAAGGAAAMGASGSFGRSAFMRFAGPTAAITGGIAASRALSPELFDIASGRSGEGVIDRLVRGNDAIAGFFQRNNPFAASILGIRERMFGPRTDRATTDAFDQEMQGLRFSRDMGRATRDGDTRRQQELTIQQTVAEMSRNSTALRAAGIAPELIGQRNRIVAETLADELGGARGGSVDSVATAAGAFSVGQSGMGGQTTDAILKEILSELRKQTDDSNLRGQVDTGTIG